MARKLQPAVVLRASRSLLVLISLALGLALVYLPAYPGVAVAETADGAEPTAFAGLTPDVSPELAPSPEPSPSETGLQTPDPTIEPSLEPTTEPGVSPSPEPSPAETPTTAPSADPALVVNHFILAPVRAGDATPSYLAPDTPLTDLPRFDVFRVRFELGNLGVADHAWLPLLQVVGPDGVAANLPEDAELAAPFHAAAEWIARADGGTQIGPSLVQEPVGAAAPDIVRSSGVNPLPGQSARASSTQSVEFSVSATTAAAYGATYVLRLTDNGAPLSGLADATVRMEARPPLDLTPGQRGGSAPDEGAAALRYRLSPAATSIHAPSYDLVSDSCAACHRAHTSAGSFLNASSTQYALCASCHNGTDLPSIATAYQGVPANDAGARAYYQHDPAATTGALGTSNDCAACHNPHNITTTPAAETAGGWTASGRLAGVSDVELEYQLCYRCHASPATLPSNAGQPLSRYALDKAVEFDPSNASYHPIESAGTNATTQMDASLGGTSPYKLWNFTSASTVRCVNCHADARIASTALSSGEALAAGADLPVHASTQRGILLAPYQDRTLNGPLASYQAADFALCYLCHAEAPFVDASGEVRADTNFRYHGLHVSGAALVNHGSDGTNIDTPSDGGGLATCAECHFRIHSTAYPVYSQPSGSRLVDFAPNVSGGATTANWTPKSDATPGTCSLKCHGQPHVFEY